MPIAALDSFVSALSSQVIPVALVAGLAGTLFGGLVRWLADGGSRKQGGRKKLDHKAAREPQLW